MISTMVIEQAQRRVQTFQQRCGEYGEAALHLAYHAALPVALNAELLHLLRINFFLDPPEILPHTVEFEFLLSPLCREIDEGLYEIEPEIRDALLAGLSQTYDAQRTRDIATLLWQYVDRHSPWFDRVELERAQQLTALNFLNPEKAQQWLVTVETEVSQGQVAAREWFVAMRKDIENQAQQSRDEEAFTALVHALNDQSSGVRHRAVEALGRIGNDKAISALLNALNDTSSKVRLSAALALGQLGSDKAVPVLLKALKDRNRTVRSMAVEALKRMGHDNVSDALVDKEIDQLLDELPQFSEDQNQLEQKAPAALLRSLSTSQTWTFQNEIVRIGRTQDNDLVLPDMEEGISRQHAEISRRYSADNVAEPTYFLRDFSRYGTWVLLPKTEEWQKINQQEVILISGTQLKFGSSKNSALEFLIAEADCVRQETEIFKQFQGSLENGREAAAWLDENLAQLAETGGRLALDQFPDVKEAASLEQVEDFNFSLEQFLERISHCLTWGRYNILDELDIPIIFEKKVYVAAFRKIKKRLPEHLNENAQKQLVSCVDYLIEVLERVEEIIEKEDQDESSTPNEEVLREPQKTIQANPQPVHVFISYARKDEVFYNQLVKHLSVLRRERVIAVWHDRLIQPGEDWAQQISNYLENADIILFLISADFLASDASNAEVIKAIERHDAGEARVLPIILRPVELQDSPLNRLQVLPKDGKPITSWGTRNDAFLDVAQGIREAAEQIMVRSQPAFNQLPLGQRRRLEKRYAELQERFSLLNRQLQHLRRDYVIETNAAMRLQFQKQIEAIDLEIEQLESDLESLEQQLHHI